MSLSVKILVAFVAAFATLAAITITFQYRAMRAAMYEAEESSESNILGTIQTIVREDPIALHTEALPRAIRRLPQQLPQVARVVIYDPQRRIIADSDPRISS